MAYQLKEFVEASKFMDFTDKETYMTIGVVNESEQKEILLGITNKLYEKIEAKATNIDFGTIPASKGDITKVDNISMVLESLDDMKKIYNEYKQPTSEIQEILEAVENVQDLKIEFQRGFMTNTSLPIVLYNTTVLSIISATSLLISTTIDFIVDPRSKSIEVSIDRTGLKDSKNLLALRTLESFNNSCRGGKLKTLLQSVTKVNVKNLVGTSAIALIGVSISLIFTIVPLLREVVYYYYYCSTSIADYFDTQATMLSLNAARLEMAGDPKTANEQRKFVDRFRRISDALSINSKDSVNKATGDIKKESKEKFKIDDVTDSLPDSAASSLF